MTKIEECKKLAQELQLTGTLEHIESLKDAQVLTALKFRPTTMKEIEAKVLMDVRSSTKQIITKSRWTIVLLSIGGLFSGVCLGYLLPHTGPHLNSIADCAHARMLFLSVLIGMVGLGIGFSLYEPGFWSSFVRVNILPLKNWKNGLPYGALLAVLQAKEVGLKEFRIAFPTRASDCMLEDDPVIYAEKNGVLYEVFAWADGKIYE